MSREAIRQRHATMANTTRYLHLSVADLTDAGPGVPGRLTGRGRDGGR